MAGMFWKVHVPGIFSGTSLPALELALATPVVLWGGLPFFQRFWTSLINRSPNMFTLIGLVTKLVSDLCYVWVDPRVKFD